MIVRPYMTSTRAEVLRWASYRRPWTLAELAIATRPDMPEDLARARVRRLVKGLVEAGYIREVGTRGPFRAKLYEHASRPAGCLVLAPVDGRGLVVAPVDRRGGPW